MSAAQDQHAAVVVLDSIQVLAVNTAGARDLTNDATLANVAGQGYAVQYSINGTFTSLAAWINAIGQLHQTPFDDKVAAKVISALSPFIRKNGPAPEADSARLKQAQASQTLKSSKSYCPISNALKTLDLPLNPLEPA
ncbi:hypothetical protein EV714DRAFT_239506 [Schizophyllum commune]